MLPQPDDFQTMVEESPYGVLVHDAHTWEILWANPATLRMLGLTLPEILPLKSYHMSGRSEPYRRSVGIRWLQRAVDEGTAGVEWMYRAKDGHEILTEAIATRLRLGSRDVVMVQFRDIEREERTRQKLTRTQAMLTAFLSRMEEGILIVDDDATITYASQSSERMLGAGQGEIENASLLEICTRGCRRAVSDVLRRSRQDGRSQPFRFEVGDGDGLSRWFAASCQHIDEAGGLRGNLILFHDITERVLSARQQTRDLQHLNYLARFNAMGDMATTIEHEIAQPLAAAMNFLAGTQHRHASGALDADALLAGVGNARLQLERANVILKSLRTYATHLEQSVQRVDLNDIVAESRQLIELRAGEKGVRVVLTPSAEAVPVWCERVLTGQVVLNLSFNAIDEMSEWPPEERIVRIETRRTGSGGLFRVVDTGKGLAHIPDGRIFDGAFTSKSSGHGIGLALSHQVIQRQGGTISARENLPHGAIFEFTLPSAAGPPAKEVKDPPVKE